MKVEIYEYDDNFGGRYAVKEAGHSLKPHPATEDAESWRLFNAPNNWKNPEDAKKWCKENGYEIVSM